MRKRILFLILFIALHSGCKSETQITSNNTGPAPKQTAVSVCSPLLEDSRKFQRYQELKSTQACGSEQVVLEGKLEILSANTPDGERLEYFLTTQDSKVILFSETEPDHFKSGDDVTVQGTKSFCGTFAAGQPNLGVVEVQSIQPTYYGLVPNNTTTYSLGEQSVAVIMVNFSNATISQTKAQLKSLVFTDINNFYIESSFNKTWLTGDVFGPYTMSVSNAECNIGEIASQATNLATAGGVDLSKYKRVIYYFPETPACTWYGLGSVGTTTSQAWINGDFSLHTIAHELGHNIGLYHSNALSCGATSTGLNCASIEYGDVSDAMGNKFPGHFTAYQKERLGWLDYSGTPPITTVTTPGSYFIEPYATTSGSISKAVKVRRSINSNGTSTYYYVEYRQSIGFDNVFSTILFQNNLTSGVLVHRGNDTNGNSSYLLQMNPSTNTWYKSALNVGQTFTDPNYGVAISLLSANSSQAEIGINFVPITQPVNCVSP